MDINPIQPSEKSNNYDFDHDQIYDTETGNTVSEMSFEVVLNKILEEDKNNV